MLYNTINICKFRYKTNKPNHPSISVPYTNHLQALLSAEDSHYQTMQQKSQKTQIKNL